MCVTLPMPGSVSIMIFFGSISGAMSVRTNYLRCFRAKSDSELKLMLLSLIGVENTKINMPMIIYSNYQGNPHAMGKEA